MTMSQKELDRLSILNKVRDGQITQVKAAELLGISDRQIRNLIQGLNTDGPQGIVSKKRGKRKCS